MIYQIVWIRNFSQNIWGGRGWLSHHAVTHFQIENRMGLGGPDVIIIFTDLLPLLRSVYTYHYHHHWSPSHCQTFNIVSMVMDTLTGKLGCTPILCQSVPSRRSNVPLTKTVTLTLRTNEALPVAHEGAEYHEWVLHGRDDLAGRVTPQEQLAPVLEVSELELVAVPLGRHQPQLRLDVALLHRRDTDILHEEGNFYVKSEFLVFSAGANLSISYR